MADVPTDQASRDRIAGDLRSTLFVEAGAGSGKTTALVGRALALVLDDDGPVPLASIAAITFTEKAGAELRERLRRRLEETAEGTDDPTVRQRCRTALDELDGAAIGTLHSFAQRILGEHPVEAGLPPRVEVLDEVSSGIEMERRWASFSDELFEDPAYARTLLLLSAAGVRDSTPHALARTFEANWDLVESHVDPDADPPGDLRPLVTDFLDQLDRITDLRSECRDPADKLLAKLDALAEWAGNVRALPDDISQVRALRDARTPPTGVGFRSNGGRKASWDTPCDAIRSELRALDEAAEEVLREVATRCAHHLGAAIRRFTLSSAAERRRSGALEFHDLLVLARGLLRDPEHGATVRTALHDRYRRLLLDEFQDTDPIQIELAVRIAAADPASEDAAAPDWRDVTVAPGRLFVVGDPKQSIYRFRRADIGVFLDAHEMLTADGGRVSLTTNFRTGAPVTRWVDATFGPLMDEPTDGSLPLRPRPGHTALDPVREGPPDGGGPPVCVLGRTPHPPRTSATEVRVAEAAEVVATVRRAVAERWQVDDGDGGWRDVRPGDIAILIPARTSLPFLEDALASAGIPYRTESSSLVYGSRAVRDLLLVLRAVADPTDELRTVSALRTPLFGCGDDDLYRFRVERGGRWDHTAGQPDTVPDDDPVRRGLETLSAWHRRLPFTGPSVLLDEIVRDRRAMELAFAEGRPRDVWRRLRFVVDQARAWVDVTGGDVRGYLAWIGHQTEEGARVAEAVLPETDDDAVRIMTIHAAKGLEFPVTIVSGASSRPGGRVAAGDARFVDGRVAYYLGKHAETTEFSASRPLDEQMDLDERIRLLYVATTRARDHLVVSLHRVERSKPPVGAGRSNAELLVEGMGHEVLAALPDGPAEEALPLTLTAPPDPVPAPPPMEVWQADRDAALAAASRPSTVSATALTDEGRAEVDSPVAPVAVAAADPDPSGQLHLEFTAGSDHPDLDVAADGGDAGLRKRPRDLDRPPWLKGRYGTAVGRAVHGVLQTVDLSLPGDHPTVASAVAAQAAAEAIHDRADLVQRLVTAALGAETVRAAAAAPHWREVYASTPVGGRLLEGYVDLLYRGPDGLVVVDYKTAATSDPTELDRRVEGYRTQGASYALAVARSTGEPVAAVVFCFLTPDGVVERRLDDLEASVAAVAEEVRAGTAVEEDRATSLPAPP